MVTAPPPVSHRDIIDRAGGPAATAEKISAFEMEAGRPAVPANTTKAWKRLDSIPAAYFEAFAGTDLATLDELAAAAATRKARVLA